MLELHPVPLGPYGARLEELEVRRIRNNSPFLLSVESDFRAAVESKTVVEVLRPMDRD